MTGASPEDGAATWPPDTVVPDEECVPARCEACALPWRVHRSMAGFRIRCRCGAWISVPAPAEQRALPGGSTGLAMPDGFALAAPSEDEEAFLAASPRPRELAGIQGWDGRPLRPDADGSWSLRHASIETRSRWTNHTVLSLAAIMACFWGPAMVVQFLVDGPHHALYWPIFAVASSLLVLVVAHNGREYATSGLRGAKPRYFVESACVAAVACFIALAWVKLLESSMPEATHEVAALRAELGLPLVLFVISLCPGVFEELAFRGILQGRLQVLMGRVQGIFVVGAAFGVAHGLTPGLPFHIGLGIYLAFLRDRSGSLLPCMLAHMLYNAGIVLGLS